MIDKPKIKDYLILYIAFLIYSGSTIFSKIASQQNDFSHIVFFMSFEFICLLIYAIIWQQILMRFPLVVAMANKGSIVIISLIWSVTLFKEHITIYNIIGACIIVIGIWMVSGDE